MRPGDGGSEDFPLGWGALLKYSYQRPENKINNNKQAAKSSIWHTGSTQKLAVEWALGPWENSVPKLRTFLQQQQKTSFQWGEGITQGLEVLEWESVRRPVIKTECLHPQGHYMGGPWAQHLSLGTTGHLRWPVGGGNYQFSEVWVDKSSNQSSGCPCASGVVNLQGSKTGLL